MVGAFLPYLQANASFPSAMLTPALSLGIFLTPSHAISRQLGVRRAPPPEEMFHFVPVAATGARPPETVPAHRSGPTRKRIKLTGYRPHEALGINMNSEGQIMVRLARKGSAGHEWARLVETPRDLIATAISRQFRGNIPRMQGAQPK